MERERAEEKGRGAETRRDTGEKGLRGFWLQAPVGGKTKLTRKEGSTLQFLEEIKLQSLVQGHQVSMVCDPPERHVVLKRRKAS